MSLNFIDIVFSFASLLHFNAKDLKPIFNKIYVALNQEGIFYLSLKHDIYQEKIKIDEFGRRFFYYYTEEDLVGIAENKFKLIYSGTKIIKKTEWLEIIFKKA